VSIYHDVIVLSYLTRRPRTSEALRDWWTGAPQDLNESLYVLASEGAIACTDGTWWRRNNGKKVGKHGEK
jgi:hypothetical protein